MKIQDEFIYIERRDREGFSPSLFTRSAPGSPALVRQNPPDGPGLGLRAFLGFLPYSRMVKGDGETEVLTLLL
jgi:hypothetical protein